MRRRLNLLDALILLMLGGLLPMGYFAHGLLQHRWGPYITGVEPRQLRRGVDWALCVNGERFDRWSRVAIDGQPMPQVRFLSPRRLEVRLPALPEIGLRMVAVTDFRQRTAMLHDAFLVVEPPPEVPATTVPPPLPVVEPTPVAKQLVPLPVPMAVPLPLRPEVIPLPVKAPPVLSLEPVRVRGILLELDRRMIDVLRASAEAGARTADGARVVGLLSWGSMPAEIVAQPLSLPGALSGFSPYKVRSRGTVWVLVDLELEALVDRSTDPPQASRQQWAIDTGSLLPLFINDRKVLCLLASRPTIAWESEGAVAAQLASGK